MNSTVGAIIAVVVSALTVLILLGYDSLEYQEIGLNFSWISETIEAQPYPSGRYYLGIGNHFIKFPKTVKSIYFTDELAADRSGPALQSRTQDGLSVRLEVSFQYRLLITKLYDMYTALGPQYEQIYVRMAIEQLTTAATLHKANYFFTNRSTISQDMHSMLDGHLKKHAGVEVPFFQLRTVHLPKAFEDAIKETQVKQQETQIAALEQKTKRVSFQTKVLRAEQAVKVLHNQAVGETASILAQNDAYCKQYNVTQQLQAEALSTLMGTAGWTSKQLLDYLRIRVLREHPADRTTVTM
mmetsp:Transcript_51055/g.150530  ORF Transcript_51055/g.150530 Transcript_51055/m.150530 type:complete len:298 (+) Transcript_51055:118-1011(+)